MRLPFKGDFQIVQFSLENFLMPVRQQIGCLQGEDF
jgi:hypothetical protein